MYSENMIWMAKNDAPVYLLPHMANRHGLIAGATGTGKTITLKVMAESFSDAGVPVFLSDIKGDLSGMGVKGVDSEGMQKRIAKFGLAEKGFEYKAYPTTYWDVFGEKGIPVRTTVSEMGPMLLSRIMNLTAVQDGVLNLIFRIADDEQLLLIDLKDLKSMVQYVSENVDEYKISYGNMSKATLGAIQRGILKLEDEGGDLFFGEPVLDIMDWMKTDENGRGYINNMNCEVLFQKPQLYATFLLWMLSEIYETLPEAGDLDKPKMVFFFDEAHLLFEDAPKELLKKIEQIVRLIRSKAVGIYFITQNPTDIPDDVLSQLGNRIQHALRAYSPSDQKAVKVAAETFRPNPAFDTKKVITELGTGEALVSFLDENGAPGIVQRAFILPPQSLMGPADEDYVRYAIQSCEMGKKYNDAIDRESAYEVLNDIAVKEAEEEKKAKEEAEAKKAEEAAAKEKEKAQAQEAKERERAEREAEKARLQAEKEAQRAAEKARREAEKAAEREAREKEKTRKSVERVAKSAINSFGRQAARSLVRGLLGSLKK